MAEPQPGDRVIVRLPDKSLPRDPRARITCRRCGAQPGRQCITSSGTGAPMVHAERRNDWRRAEGQTAGMMDPEGVNLDRFPPPPRDTR